MINFCWSVDGNRGWTVHVLIERWCRTPSIRHHRTTFFANAFTIWISKLSPVYTAVVQSASWNSNERYFTSRFILIEVMNSHGCHDSTIDSVPLSGRHIARASSFPVRDTVWHVTAVECYAPSSGLWASLLDFEFPIIIWNSNYQKKMEFGSNKWVSIVYRLKKYSTRSR